MIRRPIVRVLVLFAHPALVKSRVNRGDAYELLDAGVTRVYRDTLDTSLRMGIDALRLLGFRAYQAQRAARTFLRHDEESVRLNGKMRGDRVQYINAARERIADLERILLADLEDRGLEQDAGWDAESLREDARRGGFSRAGDS